MDETKALAALQAILDEDTEAALHALENLTSAQLRDVCNAAQTLSRMARDIVIARALLKGGRD